MENDHQANEVTEILLAAVAAVLGTLNDDNSRVPTKALLAYEYIRDDGTEAFDFVVSSSMGRLETIGHARHIEHQIFREIAEEDEVD